MPEMLVKYLSDSKGYAETFASGALRLTPIQYLNDFWEFRRIPELPTRAQMLREFVSLWNDMHTPKITKVISSASDLTHNQRREWRIYFKTNGKRTPKKAAREAEFYVEKFGEDYGVLSLSDNPVSRLMWAHYAACHSGYAACFLCRDECLHEETETPAVLSPFGPALKVSYEDITKPLPKTPVGCIKQFITKHTDWEYESEWRVIDQVSNAQVVPNKDGNTYYELSYDPETLQTVIYWRRQPKKGPPRQSEKGPPETC